MFSAFRRIVGKSDSVSNSNGDSTPTEVRPGLQTMSSSLQKKFARGVQYNMKIIIKGDRSVGKTCLFLRLQGQKFKEEYVPSDEIAVASIQWSYKATDDVVKVEVWDVVDKGRKRRPIDGLKLANSGDGMEEPALDAEFLDVYKGTNGVIIVMDITKAWTFEYVQRELVKVPGHIPVVILANHLDMNHHRTVTADKVQYFIESVERQAPVRYTEGSMRNGFGLRYLHKFLNVPFLQLQRETLLAQLTTNDEESQLTLQELDMFQENETNYDKFLDNLTSKRRQAAESTGVVGVPQPVNTLPAEPSVIRKSMSVPAQMSSSSSIPVVPASVVSPVVSTIPTLQPQQQSKPTDNNIVSATEALTLSNLDPSIVSVEEFVPDGGGLDHSFLEEPTTPQQSNNQPIRVEEESESEPEMENPLVAGFQDDIDADDFVVPVSLSEVSNPVKIRESPASSVSSIEDLSEVKSGPDILNDWLLPDKTRRSSPEGREEGESDVIDTPHVLPVSTVIPTIIVESEQTEKKKKKTSAKEKKEKVGEKKKSSSKEKKKKKVKKERDELEDFLNGSVSSPVEDAYEAL